MADQSFGMGFGIKAVLNKEKYEIQNTADNIKINCTVAVFTNSFSIY